MKESSVRYFDSKTICRSCDKRIKKENQIVYNWCHENELNLESF